MSELRVTITDERGVSETQSVAVPQETNDPTKANANATPKTATGAKNTKSSKGLAIASMVGSRVFNYTTSNVGKWTGSSRTQQSVNNVLQMGSLAAVAYANPYIALATMALQLGTTAIDNAYERKWNTTTSNARLERAGYNNVGEIVGRRHK